MIREGLTQSLSEIIRDQLHLKEMPTVELSARLNLTTDETKNLMKENFEMTPNLAERLEQIFNIPAHFWMGFKHNNNVFYMEQV